MIQQLRLTIELVPKTSWCDNMRKAVSKADWDRIRKEVYARYNHECGICHSQGQLNCHEIWQYDDEQRIQTLVGFIALCNWCHHVKHIGYASILAKQGKLDYERVVQHFVEVNDCSRVDFLSHKFEAFELWRKRSRHKWKIDLGKYKNLVKR